MTETMIFLVKNGIGFGHIRRAMLLAEAVQDAGRLHPIVVSQASSLALYQGRRVSVVNFPLLHRVSSAVTEDCYLELLDELLRRLDPAVIVEDTYPDPRYAALDALREVPKILVMRRLDGLSFDQLRSRGAFAPYSKVMVAQDEPAFLSEGHSPDSLTTAMCSDRFTFVGNIFGAPAPSDVQAARASYAPHGERLVVVTAGAGGDQMPDGYTDRLFGACSQIADRLHSDHPDTRFVLVTGPYYAGRPLHDGPNVVVRRFDPHLAALLHAAHVAVLKPGNNVLSEALSGGANLVLVPDVSFMEGLEGHARRVTAAYGGTIARPHAEELEPLIRKALDLPRRTRRIEPNTAGTDMIVEAIHRHAEARSRTTPPVVHKQLLLVLAPPDGQDATSPDEAWLPPGLEGASILGGQSTPEQGVTQLTAWAGQARRGTTIAHTILVDSEPPLGLTPDDLVESGVRLLLTRGRGHDVTVRRWLRLHPSRRTLLIADLYPFRARPGDAAAFTRRIRLLLDDASWTGVYLDIGELATPTEATNYLRSVADWLRDQPVRLTTPVETHRRLSRALLEPSP